MDTEKKIAGTGIGAPMRRLEDRRFVTGKGDFVDDLALPNMAFAYVAAITARPRQDRQNRQGALPVRRLAYCVFSPAHDVTAENIKGLPCPGFPALPEGARYHRPLRPVLASGFVRHVGDWRRVDRCGDAPPGEGRC